MEAVGVALMSQSRAAAGTWGNATPAEEPEVTPPYGLAGAWGHPAPKPHAWPQIISSRQHREKPQDMGDGE